MRTIGQCFIAALSACLLVLAFASFGYAQGEMQVDPVSTVEESETSASVELAQAPENVDVAPVEAAAVLSFPAPSLLYSAHVQDIGWQPAVSDGELAGTSGRSKRVEALTIELALDGTGFDTVSSGVEYAVHVQDIGWIDAASNGAEAGTTGRSKRLEAIHIELTGAIAANYDICYRVHVQDLGWLAWTKNGSLAGTAGCSKRMEAIEIVLVAKDGGAAPEDGTALRAYYDANSILDTGYRDEGAIVEDAVPHVEYVAHLQDVGWMAPVSDGLLAGTTGEGKRVEAVQIRLNLAGTGLSGGIEYSTHVQNVGWTTAVADGATAGSMGKAQRVEAVDIGLVGDVAATYDVCYRAHAQNIGWMEWARNGEYAGTAAMGTRIEALQVVLVPTGADVPDTGITADDTHSFITPPEVEAYAHVQNLGDMGPFSHGQAIGAAGQGLRLEGLSLALVGAGAMVPDGYLEYQVHVQDIGWMDWQRAGAYAGTTGQAKRIEAVRIVLGGEAANYFDVYYQAQIQTEGWLGWACNGEVAGSTGISYRLEALKVVLCSKAQGTPGSTANHHVTQARFIPGGYLMVNRQSNCVTAYQPSGVPIKAMVCSTGGNDTPVGTFYTQATYRWRALFGGVYGQYATRIVGSILFHSVPYTSQSPWSLEWWEYNKLGSAASLGCVRLTVADAKWIYESCPVGTMVIVYDSPDPGPLGKPSATLLMPGQSWDPTDPMQ